VSCTETAEPVEMPFGMLSQVDPRNHVLDGGTDHRWERAILKGKGMFRHIRRHWTVSREPIAMLFGLRAAWALGTVC